ncbi:MAG TPA: PHB depolymerase family esterase [Steroidobacteraceae bacterium]|nr:PHB depolymerase family esterase [Steroidobacteraceae bacterium]
MATQFQLSHGRVVRGVGVFAAGPWYCARGSLARAFGDCLGRPESAPDAPALLALARAAASAGRIDPLESLAGARVWVFHGSRDATVAAPVTRALAEFYRGLVAAPDLRYLDEVAAGHGVPTESAGGPCELTAAPFLNACHYDGVGEMLAFLYGAAPAATPPDGPGTLTRFAQAPYDPAGSLAAEGYLYVPRACAGGQPCRLHVAFHGCHQGAEFVGEAFVRDAGYNRWADAHRLVVLYPQTRRSALLPMNPEGCWDWWGYTDERYATRDGQQVAAVRAMVRALAGF